MNNAMVAIVMTEVRGTVERLPADDLDGRIAAAIQTAKHHWMVLDESVQFQGCIAGLLAVYPPESDVGKRIVVEVNAIKKLNAILAAASAGLSIGGLMDENYTEQGAAESLHISERWRKAP